ncbi:hypothetical protein Q7P35_005097 [Cladosporium inversicolor]
MLGGPGASGQRWRKIVARDGARQHNGNVYNVVHNYRKHSDDREESAWRANLLGWLTFAEIDDRREQVKEAHQATFRWIFRNDNETGFASWVESGSGIYWIKGKPASGKSTLVKFITREPQLDTLLQSWTGKEPLVTGSFWFWAAGTELQRSLVGLYRTLLFQILKSDDRLCRIAFQDWQCKFSEEQPTLGMLKAAMNRLLKADALSKNFFFMIDGLDEYDRDSVGKTELAELMLDMTRSKRIKLLLSSRPETPFETVFRDCPVLRLELLTMPDISAYVEKRLWSNPSLRNIRALEEDSLYDIASFIIENAAGVFLWVVLVLNIALDGINNFEHPLAIRDRIMLLPPELDDIFTHIMTKRVLQHHRQEAFRLLLIAVQWEISEHGAIPIDTLMAVAQDASNYPKACELATLSRLQVEAVNANFSGRLHSRCQGLLEYSGESSMRVTFLHRTLFDYLRDETKGKLLLRSGVGDEFDASTAIMAGLACGAWLGVSESTIVESFFRFNKLAECSTKRHKSELVAIFDQGRAHGRSAAAKHWSNDYVPHFMQPKSNLIAFALYSGGMLYFENAVRAHQVSDTTELSLLLHWAMPWVKNDDPEIDASRISVQTPVLLLLLQHGADPAYTRATLRSPWARVVEMIAKTFENLSVVQRDKHSQWQSIDANGMLAALRLLVLFAKQAPDLPKCSVIQVDGVQCRYTALELLKRLAQSGMGGCCRYSYDVGMQRCQCGNTESWGPPTMETLSLLEGIKKGDAVKPPDVRVSKMRKLFSRRRKAGRE